MRKLSLSCLLFSLIALALVGCAKPAQQPLPVGNLKLGVAFFSHPAGNAEMIAGYVAPEVEPVGEKVLSSLDVTFARVLREKSKQLFVGSEKAYTCSKTIADAQNEPKAALRRWAQVGRCMGVDLLLVPQAYEWRPREGGSAGVVRPARVVLGFFLIDVRNETLVSRSHYEETQQALSDNLLQAGKFFKRGGRWVTAEELAEEAMAQAIEELRL